MGGALMLAALLAAADAREVAVVVGAKTEWLPCGEGPGRCAHTLTLAWTDDDAFRIGRIAASRYGDDDVFIFTTRDVSTSKYPMAARPATLTAMVDALRERRAEVGEDLDLVLFVSGHGATEGLHLDDGLWAVDGLLDRLTEAAGGEVTGMFTDACHSSAWYASRGSYETLSEQPLAVRRGRFVEVSAVEATHEVSWLGAGQLAYALVAGLLGAADQGDDGRVDAQELFDHLVAHQSLYGPRFHPVVRAPAGATPVDVLVAPDAARLRLEDPGAARWIVSWVAPGPEMVVAEAFTLPGKGRTLHLPPGVTYAIVRVPYDQVAKGAPHQVVTDVEGRVPVRVCRWEAGPDAALRFADCPLAVERSTPLDALEAGPDPEALERGPFLEKGGWDGLIAHFPGAVPRPGLPRPPLHVHGRRVRLAAAFGASSAAVARGGAMVHLMLGATGATPDGRVAVGGEVEGAREVGVTARTGPGWRLAGGPRLDVALHGGRRWRLEAMLRVRAGAMLLVPTGDPTDTRPRVGPWFEGGLGPSLTVDLGPRVGLRIEGAWAPGVLFVAAGDGLTARPFLGRVDGSLGLEVRL